MKLVKQNAGRLRSVRGWGALGLVLALVVLTVGYGQEPRQAQPGFSLPAGESIGDILTPHLEAEAFRLVEIALTINFVGRGEFTGRVIWYPLEPLDAQPDPVNKVIAPDTILGQDTFSNAKASLTLAVRSPRPIVLGLLVLMEKAVSAVTYTVSTTVRGVTFATVVDDVKFAALRGGGFSFMAPTDEEPQVVVTYKIFVESLYVQRNQRTGSGANFEGLLELRGEFSANNVAAPLWPSPTAIVSAAQSQTVQINQLITTVTGALNSSVPILAKLWEIEFCCLGQTDFGQNSGSISFNGTSTIYKDVTVTISADNWKERSGELVVRFRAEKQQ
jgi:hypothetical protein